MRTRNHNSFLIYVMALQVIYNKNFSRALKYFEMIKGTSVTIINQALLFCDVRFWSLHLPKRYRLTKIIAAAECKLKMFLIELLTEKMLLPLMLTHGWLLLVRISIGNHKVGYCTSKQ